MCRKILYHWAIREAQDITKDVYILGEERDIYFSLLFGNLVIDPEQQNDPNMVEKGGAQVYIEVIIVKRASSLAYLVQRSLWNTKTIHHNFFGTETKHSDGLEYVSFARSQRMDTRRGKCLLVAYKIRSLHFAHVCLTGGQKGKQDKGPGRSGL